ncbi:MAG: heparan-alpha-glucosaminide N-acetyltransferase domain-containing protein [Promethearchaeota archaeon]
MNKRLNSLDFLRGLAIILMIQYHIFKFWISQNLGLYERIIELLGNIAAPFFVLISGFSFNLFINNHLQKELSKTKIFVEILKRALFIFFISTTIKFLFGRFLNLEFQFLYWSIFQLVAISMIVFSFILILRKWRIIYFIFLIITVFMVTHLIYLYNLEFLKIFTKGSFPFIPWVNLFIFGLIIGTIYEKFSEELYKDLSKLFIILVVIIILFFCFFWINSIEYLNLNLFLFAFALFLILFSISYIFLDIRKVEFKLNNVLIRWGKLAFSIYYIHFIIITGVLILFSIFFVDFFSIDFQFYHFIIIFIIFLLFIEIFIRIWEKFDYILGLEWLINKISKRSLFSK